MNADNMHKLLSGMAWALERVLVAHERDEHDAELCAVERANCVAYLAHRVHADMDLVLEFRREYDAFHESAAKKKRH